MKHRAAFSPTVLVALFAVYVAALGWCAWVLVSGPLAHLVHSTAQMLFAAFTITFTGASLGAATLVGAWETAQQAPRPHRRPIHFRPQLHH